MAVNAPGLEEKEIHDLIDFAVNYHKTSVSFMEEVETLFKSEYYLESDIEDQKRWTKEPVRRRSRRVAGAKSQVEIVKPVRARSIISKFTALLAVRAGMNIKVRPKTTTLSEEEACTTLERWLAAYMKESERIRHRPVYRHSIQWFLLRGRGPLQIKLKPVFEKGQLPLLPYAPDPKTVFPVYGETGLMYVAREYTRYAWDLQKEFEKLEQARNKEALVWKAPDLSGFKPMDRVKVREYEDEDWHFAACEGKGTGEGGWQTIYSKRNPFGFIGYSEALAEDTPLEDAEWASTSILYPIADLLKQQGILMSKIATAIELFFWPRLLAQNAKGQMTVLESTPGVIQQIQPGTQITVLEPKPNADLVQFLNNLIEGEVSLWTIPPIGWSAEPRTLQSGFAVAQVLSQIKDRIEDKQSNIEVARGEHFGQLLRALDTFSEFAEGSKFYVAAWPTLKSKKTRKEELAIGSEEIGERYTVDVMLRPELPQDKAARVRMAQELFTMGIPLRILLERVIEWEDVDEVLEQIENSGFEAKLEEVQTWKQEEFLRKWRKEHKPHKPEEKAAPDINALLAGLAQVLPPEVMATIQQILTAPVPSPEEGGPPGGIGQGGQMPGEAPNEEALALEQMMQLLPPDQSQPPGGMQG